MTITLERPLYISNFTAIDGRGAEVHIAYGFGFAVYEVYIYTIRFLLQLIKHPCKPILSIVLNRHVIIHEIYFYDIKSTSAAT